MLRSKPNEFVVGAGWGGVGGFVPDEAAAIQPLNKVAVLGHSYVKRLPEPSPTLARRLQFRFFPKGGAKAATIVNEPVFSELCDFQPDLTFLIIGGNDITENTVIPNLAEKIIGVAKDVEDKAGGHCLIMGIESRFALSDFTQYNKIKNGINRYLRWKTDFSKTRYRPMEMSKEDLAADGVHLTPLGSQKLYDLIVRTAEKHLGWD